MARSHWLLSAAFLLAAARLGADPIPVKVAVVVTFEVGQDTGDKPGEFQFWAEREKWGQPVIIPGVDHPVLTDAHGTIGVVSGTTARASNQIMALVLSGKFDFSKTYWVVNGIAGVNPAVASVGSAAWAHYVIDGDVAYEIDSREADPSWPYAIIPIGSTVPNERPTREGWEPDTMA
ncbi:MAG: purine nucleoside permease, partial [Opitutaceae bacterium]